LADPASSKWGGAACQTSSRVACLRFNVHKHGADPNSKDV